MFYKVVLVTDASSGLGKSIAQSLAKKGMKVYGTGRSIKKDIEGGAMIKMDITKKDEIEAALAIILKIENRIE